MGFLVGVVRRAGGAMVCGDCEKKQTKLSNMDMWKDGSRNAQVGHGKDAGRRLGANKLLSGNRYGNMAGGASRFQPYTGGAQTKRCRLCKAMLHGDAELYCQHCAYKHGLCSMCGKNIADTSMYASGQVWDGSEDVIRDAIAKVDEEVRLEKKKAKNKGLVAAGLLGAPDDALPIGKGPPEGQEAAGQEKINVTFGKEGGLGIVFTDEGWEIEDIAEGSAAAEMETLHPGLCLIEIQGVDIVKKSDEEIREMFSGCGRPVRLTFVRDNPRYSGGTGDSASPSAETDEGVAGGDGTASGGGDAGKVAPPPPPRGQGRAGVEPAWKTRQKQDGQSATAQSGKPSSAETGAGADAAGQGGGDASAAGAGFTYNWKTGLYHNAETGYSYDQETGYYSALLSFVPAVLFSWRACLPGQREVLFACRVLTG